MDSNLKSLLEALKGCGEVVRYRHSEYLGNYKWEERDTPAVSDGSIAYGRHDHIKAEDACWKDLFIPKYMTYSDYFGSVVDRANCVEFMEQYGGTEGVYYTYGDHGTEGVAVRLDAITPEMVEMFNAMQDYPILNDETVSNLEMEIEAEDWSSWIEHDLRRAIEKKYELEDFEPDEKKFQELYYTLKERTNTYWEAESAVGGTVDIDRLVVGMTEEDLKEVQ